MHIKKKAVLVFPAVIIKYIRTYLFVIIQLLPREDIFSSMPLLATHYFFVLCFYGSW